MLKRVSDKIRCRKCWRTLQFADRFSQIWAVQAAQVSQRLCCSVTAHQLCSACVFPCDSPPLPSQGLLFSSFPMMLFQLFVPVLSHPAQHQLLAPHSHSLTSTSSAQIPRSPLQEQPKHLQCLSAGQNSWWFVRIRKIPASKQLRNPMEVQRTKTGPFQSYARMLFQKEERFRVMPGHLSPSSAQSSSWCSCNLMTGSFQR